MLGVRGPRSDAVNFLQIIKTMLNESLLLELSMEKSKITNPRLEPALFLGTLIAISKHVSSTKGKNQRLKVSQLRMLAPMDRITKKLNTAGFVSTKYKSGIPKFL